MVEAARPGDQPAVSKHVSSIYATLHLTEDPTVDRRVGAVLAYITGADLTGQVELAHAPEPGC